MQEENKDFFCFTLQESLKGPFASEQEFKEASKAQLAAVYKGYAYFSIETEETEPGMPDVIVVSKDKPTTLIEYKISRAKDDVIRFKHTQPGWIARNMRKTNIIILAWSRVSGITYCIPAETFVDMRTVSVKLGNLRTQSISIRSILK